ncbi:TAT-variant-translocated molybdopterin oxidoreductase [soil metagenome]
MAEQQFWKGLDEKFHDPEFMQQAGKEFPEELPGFGAKLQQANTSRRDFLKVLGFSVGAATIAASCEMPVRKSIPYLVKPDEITPGIANYYASSYVDGGKYCSILVKTREGRPIKIEGNNLSKITYGGTDAAAQASVLSLYDTYRPKGPVAMTKATTWADLDKAVFDKLQAIKAAGGAIRILSSTIISPSLKAAVAKFVEQYPGTELVQYDAISYSGLLDANEQSFGKRVVPNYRFENAKVIVSLGADFLGTWISPTEYAYNYSINRKVSKDNAKMSRHYQIESWASLTGLNADVRVPVKPSEETAAAITLYNLVAGKTGGATINGGKLESKYAGSIENAAADLVAAKGAALVVSGSNDVNVQLIVNALNQLLDSYGTTIDLNEYSNLRQGNDTQYNKLVADVVAGNVKGLILLNANPAYNLPKGDAFIEALKKVEVTVSLNDKKTETDTLIQYLAPDHHFLESWGDAEPRNGHISIIQPTIDPLFNTRSAGESLLRFAGIDQTYYDFVRANWNANIFGKQSGLTTFGNFWDRAVHDGVFTYTPTAAAPVAVGAATDAAPAASTGGTIDVAAAGAAALANVKSGGIELVVYEKTAIVDGKDGDNPWLQELPDPVSKVTWDNYACVSLAFAEANKLDMTADRTKKSYGRTVQTIKLNATGYEVELPVHIQPGMPDNTIAIALGYGREVVGKTGEVGENAYPFITAYKNGAQSRYANDAKFEVTGRDYKLAQTQTHFSVSDGLNQRPIVKTTTLEEYAKDPASGNHDRAHVKEHLLTLYGYHEFPGHKWGMGIDLNSCFGCGACVVACNAENNIPVVGKKEVTLYREMHWLRIDRYYFGDVDNPSAVFQPMMCQHCDNAPCENVCPVSATNHSTEGLNQMAYNRCIGTRYCANNCPYKVRRFNWFDYWGADSFTLTGALENNYDPHEMSQDLTRMVLNPDVTVRSRGVMEKCSFCVQRIQEGKLNAKKQGRKLVDGDIKTACQAACVTGAIVFGDVNNQDAAATIMSNDDRGFKVIEEIHTLPSITYLTKVRNTSDKEQLKAVNLLSDNPMVAPGMEAHESHMNAPHGAEHGNTGEEDHKQVEEHHH